MKQNTGIQCITDQLNIARVEIGRLSVKKYRDYIQPRVVVNSTFENYCQYQYFAGKSVVETNTVLL